MPIGILGNSEVSVIVSVKNRFLKGMEGGGGGGGGGAGC